MLQRKCSCDTHAIGSALCAECESEGFQRKLAIGETDDPLEREADNVANAVVQGGNIFSEDGVRPLIQRRANAATPTKYATVAPNSVDRVLTRPGAPLETNLRQDMESRFGCDFSDVRIHADTDSAHSARAVNALAYTVGRDVVFGLGQYTPTSMDGRRLIAHELAHVVQQGPVMLRRQDAQEGCRSRFTRARGFSAYIELVREAESRLSAAGYTSIEDRIHVLRGIYYGTVWSADYRVERSPVRNTGFQVYTASTEPDDPRTLLNCGLYAALRESQDLIDGRRQVDVGHLLIGLDARRSWSARTLGIPTQGGTGLDITTWLGDLGGGAGMLAYRRVTSPGTSAITIFRGTDFGGPINLEGDVAGFVVASNTSVANTTPVGLTFTGSSTIAAALEKYLLPTSGGSTSADWNNRCRAFMQMKGATFTAGGALSNRADLISSFKDQIEGFACWYLVNRLRQTRRLRLTTLRTASLHVSGASEEIATVFIDALEACQSTPGSNLAASGGAPAASVIGTGSPTACSLAIRSIELAQAAEEALEGGEETLSDAVDWARSLF